jgi:hypothetical protein
MRGVAIVTPALAIVTTTLAVGWAAPSPEKGEGGKVNIRPSPVREVHLDKSGTGWLVVDLYAAPYPQPREL